MPLTEEEVRIAASLPQEGADNSIPTQDQGSSRTTATPVPRGGQLTEEDVRVAAQLGSQDQAQGVEFGARLNDAPLTQQALRETKVPFDVREMGREFFTDPKFVEATEQTDPNVPVDAITGADAVSRAVSSFYSDQDRIDYFIDKHGEDKVRRDTTGNRIIVRVPDDETGGEKDLIVDEMGRWNAKDFADLVGSTPEIGVSLLTALGTAGQSLWVQIPALVAAGTVTRSTQKALTSDATAGEIAQEQLAPTGIDAALSFLTMGAGKGIGAALGFKTGFVPRKEVIQGVAAREELGALTGIPIPTPWVERLGAEPGMRALTFLEKAPFASAAKRMSARTQEGLKESQKYILGPDAEKQISEMGKEFAESIATPRVKASEAYTGLLERTAKEQVQAPRQLIESGTEARISRAASQTEERVGAIKAREAKRISATKEQIETAKNQAKLDAKAARKQGEESLAKLATTEARQGMSISAKQTPKSLVGKADRTQIVKASEAHKARTGALFSAFEGTPDAKEAIVSVSPVLNTAKNTGKDLLKTVDKFNDEGELIEAAKNVSFGVEPLFLNVMGVLENLPEKITISQARQIRQQIYDLIDSDVPGVSAAERQLLKVASAVDKSIDTATEGLGPEAKQLFKSANKSYKEWREIYGADPIRSIFKKPGRGYVEDSEIVDKVIGTGKDFPALIRLRDAMGKDSAAYKNTLEYKRQQMFMESLNADQRTISPKALLNQLTSMDREVRSELFQGTDKELMASLSKYATKTVDSPIPSNLIVSALEKKISAIKGLSEKAVTAERESLSALSTFEKAAQKRELDNIANTNIADVIAPAAKREAAKLQAQADLMRKVISGTEDLSRIDPDSLIRNSLDKLSPVEVKQLVSVIDQEAPGLSQSYRANTLAEVFSRLARNPTTQEVSESFIDGSLPLADPKKVAALFQDKEMVDKISAIVGPETVGLIQKLGEAQLPGLVRAEISGMAGTLAINGMISNFLRGRWGEAATVARYKFIGSFLAQEGVPRLITKQYPVKEFDKWIMRIIVSEEFLDTLSKMYQDDPDGFKTQLEAIKAYRDQSSGPATTKRGESQKITPYGR